MRSENEWDAAMHKVAELVCLDIENTAASMPVLIPVWCSLCNNKSYITLAPGVLFKYLEKVSPCHQAKLLRHPASDGKGRRRSGEPSTLPLFERAKGSENGNG